MNKLQIKILPYNNENGYTLALVLMVIMVFSVLGMSIMAMSMNSLKMSSSEQKDQSVFYIAEAAMTVEMESIEKIVNEAYSNSKDQNSFFNELTNKLLISSKPSSAEYDDTPGYNPSAEIAIKQLNNTNPRSYKVTATGDIDTKKRVVEQEFSVEWVPKNSGPGLKMAVLVKEDIKIPNGAITGDIGTIKKGPDSITVDGGGSVKGAIFVPFGYEQIAINKPSWMNDFPKATGKEMGEFYKLPAFPTFPALTTAKDSNVAGNYVKVGKGILSVTVNGNKDVSKHTYKLNTSVKFNEIKLTNDEDLYFDIGMNNIEIIVDKLNLINGHIHLIGGGKLTVYITEETFFGSGSTINNNGDMSKVNIYLKGSNTSPKNTFTVSGNQKIRGSLYAEDANIVINSGGGFNGNIFTGGTSIIVSGGTWTTSPMILAPNAKFQHQNGIINGVILAKSFEMSGGARLNYGLIELGDGPISPEGVNQNSNSGRASLNKKVFIEK